MLGAERFLPEGSRKPIRRRWVGSRSTAVCGFADSDDSDDDDDEEEREAGTDGGVNDMMRAEEESSGKRGLYASSARGKGVGERRGW